MRFGEHIKFNGAYCVYYPSNIFRNRRSFENWAIFSDIPQFELGNTGHVTRLDQSRERNYLMDHKPNYSRILIGSFDLLEDRRIDSLVNLICFSIV